jgi:PAS domain S-box-containing protein
LEKPVAPVSETLLMAEANPSLGTDEQFRLFVDTVEDHAIFMMTADGVIATWNAGVGRILGFSEADFVGRHASLIFIPEDIEKGIPELEMRTAAATGRAENERWHRRKDGSRFWGLGVLTALRDPGGKVTGFAKIMRDRTDLKELQEALRHRAEELVTTDERKNVFLATLAHEIRNHLGGIVSAADLLGMLSQGQPNFQSPLQIIGRQTRQLRRLVDDLMDIARINTGKVVLQKQRVELQGVVAAAVETCRPAVAAGRHHLAVLAPPAPVWLDADPARLQQVFVNLLTNACKYTPEGGHIDVGATVEGNEAVTRVKDNGIGLSAEMQARVFDLFAQAEDARPRSQGGLGLGLALVKNLVELHGGTVQARSDGEGKGSEFVVRLPLPAG